MFMNLKKQAFTLVELIVVISIIAILSTIAFISLQSYSESARDSTRISNLSTMKTSLELFHLDAWKYPKTTDWFEVTYSGTTVWYQWVFWDSTVDNVNRLNKIPTDPLTEKKYTYSISNNRQEFQLGWLMEWEIATISNNLLHQANAWDIIATAIVTWNYNWILFKTLTWSSCEVLAVPSIISALEPTVTTNLIDIINSGALVYNWFNNLPSEYINSKYNSIGWFNFNPTNIIAYKDSSSCSDLYKSDATGEAARKALIEWLQASYSGTIIQDDDWILAIMAINPNDPGEVKVLWWALVNNSLGWKITTSSAVSTSWWSCVFGASTFDNCTF